MVPVPRRVTGAHKRRPYITWLVEGGLIWWPIFAAPVRLPRGHRVSPVCRGRRWVAFRLGVVGGWGDAPPSTPPWVPDRGPARRSSGDALKQPRCLAGVASVDGVSVVCSLAQLEPRGDFVLEVCFPLVFSRPV